MTSRNRHGLASRAVVAARAILVLLAIAAAVVSIAWLPEWQGEAWKDVLPGRERPAFVNEARRTVLQFWAGVLVATGFYFGWRRIVATDRTNAIAAEGQVTERYTRAVEQLGHASVAVRIGGIYALDRIAVDSERDRRTIRDVLSAFVRQAVPLPDAPDEPSPPRGDVQAALTVLGTRRYANDERLDLSNCELSGYQLEGLCFDGCDARDSRFIGSELSYATFRRSDLRGANFGNAVADRAEFDDATLVATRWDGATAAKAVFSGADLTKASMESMTAGRARFVEADFREAQLGNSHLQHADFSKATFYGARIVDSDLHAAQLTSALLDYAELQNTSLTACTLTRASFIGTRLLNVNFVKANGLDADELTRLSYVDGFTTFPEGIERPSWP